MSVIRWKEFYNVNVKKIDEQHQKMAELLNGLLDMMSVAGNDEALIRGFSELLQYTKNHILYENELMEIYQFPRSIELKKVHGNLLKQLEAIDNKIKEGRIDFRGDILVFLNLTEFLKNWLINHVLHTDKELGQWLNNRGVY
ncbi:MAG: bacteriohemerythrin [Candidatus Kryptoniota bacterium]